MTPSDWIKVLYIYGPMAVFVVMVFVLLGKAKSNDGLSNEQRRVQAVAYSLVWASIFVLAAIIVMVWLRTNLPKEFEVRGIIHNLQDPETISTRDDLFLRRKYRAGRDFDYEWRVISTEPMTEPVAFLLQTNPNSVEAERYEIPMQRDFYQGFVEITYDRSTQKMYLAHGNTRAEMIPQREEANISQPSAFKESGLVYAQNEPDSIDELIRALDSSDPIIRQNARKELISRGFDGLPKLEAALTDTASSDRLKIEILSTLNGMTALNSKFLNASTACAIIRAASDLGNPALRREATVLVKKGVRVASTCVGGDLPAMNSTSPVNLLSTIKTLQKKGWHPVDLTSDSNAGLFVLDSDGVISRISMDPQGFHLERLFRLPGASTPIGIAASSDSVFAAADSGVGCLIFRYPLAGKSTSQKLADPKPFSCGGIAATGTSVYVLATGPVSEVRFWSKWEDHHSKSWRLANGNPFVGLAFDSLGNRLLAGTSSGQIYGISIQSGKTRLLTSDVGWVNSIAANADHILLASGKKILLVARSDNRGENPPAGLNSLTGGHVSGIAFDGAGRLWFTDYDNGIIKGPVPVS